MSWILIIDPWVQVLSARKLAVPLPYFHGGLGRGFHAVDSLGCKASKGSGHRAAVIVAQTENIFSYSAMQRRHCDPARERCSTISRGKPFL